MLFRFWSVASAIWIFSIMNVNGWSSKLISEFLSMSILLKCFLFAFGVILVEIENNFHFASVFLLAFASGFVDNFWSTIWLWWKQNLAPSMLSYDQSWLLEALFFNQLKMNNLSFFCRNFDNCKIWSQIWNLPMLKFFQIKYLCIPSSSQHAKFQISAATLRLEHFGSR